MKQKTKKIVLSCALPLLAGVVGCANMTPQQSAALYGVLGAATGGVAANTLVHGKHKGEATALAALAGGLAGAALGYALAPDPATQAAARIERGMESIGAQPGQRVTQPVQLPDGTQAQAIDKEHWTLPSGQVLVNGGVNPQVIQQIQQSAAEYRGTGGYVYIDCPANTPARAMRTLSEQSGATVRKSQDPSATDFVFTVSKTSIEA